MFENIENILSWGFGKHFSLIVLLPFILLLSYTRVHKNQKVDILIPIGGIILALFVSIECTYRVILMLAPVLMHAFE